ncbi:hypothetical protein [Chelativorans composti]|uniref:Uncharacterized protein n=1 Tax=Chelativorans composti TaxID=768533 RepID=A0ABW5DJ76_9HYPH
MRNSRGDVGQQLVNNGLAHQWKGYKESWC